MSARFAPTGSTPYSRTPVAIVDNVAELAGTGKVTGCVTVRFTSDRTAYVSTDGAHVNDSNPALQFRGRDYLAGIHVTRNGDGPWIPSRVHVTDRAKWTDAPRTFTDAIAAAATAVVEQLATPDVLGQAAAAVDAQRLHHLRAILPELESKAADAARELDDVRREVADLTAAEISRKA